MMTHSYDQQKEENREAAFHQVEKMMKSSRLVVPRAGFSTRWVKRYRKENERLMRRQAAIFVLINTIISFSLLGVIAWIYFYGTESFGGAVAKLVSQMTSSWTEVQVFFKVLGSIIETVPGVIHSGWWIGIVSAMGIILIAWFARIKKSFSITSKTI